MPIEKSPVVNALTIDVEDYFHVHAFADVIRPADWNCFESRVERNTYRLLDLIDSQSSSQRVDGGQSDRQLATFFVLAWVAERYPSLIREIHARGHEVACHGYSHECIFHQTKEQFKEDVKRAKGILENLTGDEVIGYRAPTYSVTKETLWALEILFELGFRYDSSIFPIKHDYYSFPEAPRFPFWIDFSDGDIISQFKNPKYLREIPNYKAGKASKKQRLSLASADSCVSLYSETSGKNGLTADCAARYSAQLLPRLPHGAERLCRGEASHLSHCGASRNCLVEFPLSTMTLLGRNLPCAGGGYFRLFPYRYTRYGLKRINEQLLESAVFYLHPWEIDPELPMVPRGSWLAKFRTYVNLRGTEAKLVNLLNEFRFAPLSSLLINYCS